MRVAHHWHFETLALCGFRYVSVRKQVSARRALCVSRQICISMVGWVLSPSKRESKVHDHYRLGQVRSFHHSNEKGLGLHTSVPVSQSSSVSIGGSSSCRTRDSSRIHRQSVFAGRVRFWEKEHLASSILQQILLTTGSTPANQ